MMIKKESVSIVLNQFKNGNITEDEAITLLEDLCSNNTIINNPPSYPWPSQPWITYTTEYEFPNKIQKYEVTCKTE